MIQCYNHSKLQANNLCIKCGRWYCDNCMNSLTPEPICKTCANNNKEKSNNNFIDSINLKSIKIPDNIFLGIFGISFLLFLTFTIVIHHIFIIPLIFSLLLVLIILFVMFRKKRKTAVTEAQIKTLLKMTDNRLTAEELSKKTQIDLSVAAEELNEMFLSGKLEMDEENGEIYYYLLEF